MARRTSWVTWGLTGILAVVLASGSVLVGVHYRSRVPRGQRWLALLHRKDWGFGKSRFLWITSPASAQEEASRSHWFDVGFFSVRVQ